MGPDEFPLGDTEALRVQRSKVCLSKLAEALISCNVGWQLDTKRNQTVTDLQIFLLLGIQTGHHTLDYFL